MFLQSCVKTLLLSCESYLQNVLLPTPKMHYTAYGNISATNCQNLAGMVIHYSVHSVCESVTRSLIPKKKIGLKIVLRFNFDSVTCANY